jgi:NAD(P)-dependent dehydrogenase (short-subunit alcohol dehydrogenase family)
MARVFVTGSSDGLGLMAARLLIEQGHDVVLHGRNDQRCRDARAAAPDANGVVSGDSPPSPAQRASRSKSTNSAASTP